MARSRSSSNFIYGLLAIALAVLLVWLWWTSGHPKRPTAKSKVPPPVAAKTLRPATPGVIVPAIPPAIHPAAPPVIPPAVTTSNVPASNAWPRPVQNIFEAQLVLVGQGISSGSLDGVTGSQTRAALVAFQRTEHLPPTGELDALTREKLQLDEPPYTTYTITSEDLARLQPIAATWLGKSQQTALDYENILELVAEKSFAHPNFLRRLNPGINWTNVMAGTTVQVPNASYPEPDSKAAFIQIHLAGKTLEAFDADTNLLAHFPCSIARRVEKRPVGELHVAVVAPHPNYTFDPDVFPESPEAQELKRKLILPPGPNNPVGVAWIGLDKPGYGIHGTPRPEDVGRTESHGCFRLANWNAEYLLRLVTVGTPVYVVE
jgi:lipoprotein-anchoring transpeptidase ErfK/SrfK